MSEYTKLELKSTDVDGSVIKVTIEGETDMPFWKHDLKINAVKELLETIDRKHYLEENKHVEFEKEMEELQNLINAVREIDF